MSGPTYLSNIPNQLYCMSKCEQEVLRSIHEAKVMPNFTIKPFVLSICVIVFKPALSMCSPSLLFMF